MVLDPNPVPDSVLDRILGLQILVAWAGEGPCEPPRLGWWRTDLVDLGAGGALLEELLPRTFRWAALEAVRGAARQADTKAREAAAEPDRVLTLYHLGFGLDERLDERLARHKRKGTEPAQVCADLALLDNVFDAATLEVVLRGEVQPPGVTKTPLGRALRAPVPESPELLVSKLAAGLLPLADRYPLPHYTRRR